MPISETAVASEQNEVLLGAKWLGTLDHAVSARLEHFEVLFAGEIYNGKELALSLGVQGETDPALVLHAYKRWHDDFLSHLVGEFALALCDGATRRLFLARDITGFHPLHYCFHREQLHFASTPQFLLTSLGLRPRPDETHIAEWLVALPCRSNSTFFENIRSVPPGYHLVVDRGEAKLRDTWRPQSIPMLRLRDPREYAEGLREVLTRAIADRLTLGTTVGSQLSGGLDSSSVTALSARLLQDRGDRLWAFTAVPGAPVRRELFPDRFCDERAHAQSVAAMYPNIDHVLVPNQSTPIFESIDRYSTAEGNPILNPHHYSWIYATFFEAKQRGVDRLLTGSAGNNGISYNGELALSSLLLEGRWMHLAEMARLYPSANGVSPLQALATAIRPLAPSLTRLMKRLSGRRIDRTEDFTGLRPAFARSHGIDPEEATLQVETRDSRTYRIAQIRRVDAGMLASATRRLTGVQRTDPTADQRVLEFCLSVPVEHFCRQGLRRSLIRDAMAGYLPEQVRSERRRGLQSADFLLHLAGQRGEVLAELDRMAQSDLLSRAINIPRLHQETQWSEQQIHKAGWQSFCCRLTRALSIGRFIRRMEEGTLF